VEDASVKERFPLRAARVPELLQGRIDTAAHIRRVRRVAWSY
jgi:hypothetical protein